MQMDLNIDQKLCTVFGKRKGEIVPYDGEIIGEIGSGIYRVKYIANNDTIVASFHKDEIEFK